MVSSRCRRAAGVFLGAASLIAAPSVARADRVDRLIEQGVSLRVQGQAAEALEVLTAAHGISPSARTLAQMGLAEGALHRWVDAEDHLATALASHDTPWIDDPRNREALQRGLATVRSHVGTLGVVGPADALVTVDGREVGHLPLPSALRLAEGTVHVEATSAGCAPTAVSVVVVGGGEQTVVLRLAPIAPAAPSAITPRTELDQPSAPDRWKTWAGVSLVGASVAGLAAGIVWLAIDGHASCQGPRGTCSELYDTGTQGWVALGTGAAAGAIGTMLLWSEHRSQAALAAGPGSLALIGRF